MQCKIQNNLTFKNEMM